MSNFKVVIYIYIDAVHAHTDIEYVKSVSRSQVDGFHQRLYEEAVRLVTR